MSVQCIQMTLCSFLSSINFNFNIFSVCAFHGQIPVFCISYTLFFYRWLVKPYNRDPAQDTVQIVKHGDLIRLEHVQTRRNLHAHKEVAPLTEKHFQVTGYGEVCTFLFFSGYCLLWHIRLMFNVEKCRKIGYFLPQICAT